MSELSPLSAQPPHKPARHKPIRRLGASLCVLASVVLSAAIYQPWASRRFDILDFSEFLPFLTGNNTTLARLQDFLSYYASQGRLNVLTYVFIVLKWDLFGWNVAAWYWARFAEMWLLIALVYFLLRRLGASGGGAAAGAGLYFASFPAQAAWTRLTMGEPLGLLLILSAAHLAVNYSRSQRWRLSGAAIALLLLSAVFTKEMFVAAFPFVLLLTSTNAQSARDWVSSQRVRWLAGLMLFVLFCTVPAVAVVALRASTDRYASQYGAAALSVSSFLRDIGIMVLPIQAEPMVRPWLVLLSNVVFLWILTRGWAEGFATGSARVSRVRAAVAAISLPVAAALAYLPWPNFASFYALPFLLSSSILLSIALTFLQERTVGQVRAAYIGTLLIISEASIVALREAKASVARSQINSELANVIAHNLQMDSVVVAMGYLTAQAWQGTGPTLRRYALATNPGSNPPLSVDVLCPNARSLLDVGGGGALVVSYADECGTFLRPTRSLVQRFSYPWWPFLVLRNDSIRADLLTRRSLRN